MALTSKQTNKIRTEIKEEKKKKKGIFAKNYFLIYLMCAIFAIANMCA